VESKIVGLIEAEQNGGCQRVVVGKQGDTGQRVQSFICAGRISSGDLMHSTVAINNNTALYI
jgi:hypothetical protein